MKITIAYTPGEEQAAVLIQRFADSLLGGPRVHKSDRHPPFRHIYMATKREVIPHEINGGACISAQDMV